MNRYYVFAFYDCYPSGGMGDCVGRYDNFNKAISKLKETTADNKGIWDVKKEKFVN